MSTNRSSWTGFGVQTGVLLTAVFCIVTGCHRPERTVPLTSIGYFENPAGPRATHGNKSVFQIVGSLDLEQNGLAKAMMTEAPPMSVEGESGESSLTRARCKTVGVLYHFEGYLSESEFKQCFGLFPFHKPTIRVRLKMRNGNYVEAFGSLKAQGALMAPEYDANKEYYQVWRD